MQPILVINDSPEFLALMRDFLTDEGYSAELHASGDGVLERVHAVSPALIVLDLVLGEIDGWVVLTQLRADERARHIPVILCTAASERARRHDAELLGVGVQVLEKPFDLDHMLAMIVELTTPSSPGGLDGAGGAGGAGGALSEVDEGETAARSSLGSS
jgi:CheY-like chemotaxis protein